MNWPCKTWSPVDDSLIEGRMVIDARLGGFPKWYLGPAPHINMRIPKEIYKSVMFVGCQWSDGNLYSFRPSATAFAVAVPGDGVSHTYLVTARHWLVRGSKDLPDFNSAQQVRVNMASGEAAEVGLSGHWWRHPTDEESVDVAVCPIDLSGTDTAPIPVANFLSEESIERLYIGPGDEVAITGLFSKLMGKSRNLLIVRRGSLAMLPLDKVPGVNLGDNIAREIDAYLIEVRSVGGLSGSPAFVRAPVGVDYNVHDKSGGSRVARTHVQGDYHFLGLCHGHWEIPAGARNSVRFPIANEGEDSINLGIAIIVPAYKILEVLYQPELIELRKQKEQEQRQTQGTTTPDSANQ